MSALALSFFASADTATADNSDIIERQAKPYTAGRFDNWMMGLVLVVITGAGVMSMADHNHSDFEAGIRSHYSEYAAK
jgi:hypothetical protein